MSDPLPPTHTALQRQILQQIVADIDAYLSLWVGFAYLPQSF